MERAVVARESAVTREGERRKVERRVVTTTPY